MKANFALTLSFTGIRLLHRAAGGWRIVGEVALDTEDLDGALAALRKTALELEPAGLRTKLVLPGTQIRYLTIDTAGMDADQLHAAAEAALDGATPYAVKQLVFDISPDGNMTHVAAVARETLAEAEAFAVEHRFAPISIVAIPESEAFLGEPFFGATDHAAKVLEPGDTVEPDGVAIVELGPQEWPEGPVVNVTDDAPVADENSAAAAPQDAAADDPAPVGELNKPSDLPAFRSAAHSAVEPPAAETARQGPEPQEPSLQSVGFASRRVCGTSSAPKLGGVSRRIESASLKTPKPQETRPLPTVEAPEARPPTPESPPVEDDVPDPPPAVLAAFLSRRQGEPANADGAVRKTAAPAQDSTTPKAVAAPGPDAASPQPHKTDPTDRPGMAEAAKQARPELRPERVPRPKTERQRMTVFGARQPEADGSAVVGGKPRFLGLILTAMLLIFLAGVAAWATGFVDEGLARFFAPRQPEAPVTAEVRADAPDPDIVDAGEPETTAGEEAQTAALDTDLPPDAAAVVDPDRIAEPAPPPLFDPAGTKAHYAVTGIWTIAPDVPTAPELVELDDLYMTSIDPANLSFDAVALTPEDSLRNDIVPRVPANPAPAGTEYDLDDRGLVIPTPDGAMSPDGILVYAKPPPATPPAAPERAEEAPEDANAAPLQDLAGFRPRVRPAKLVENTERRQLGGLSRSELAGYRPQLRPETEKQAEEDESETPTAQAAASSLRPSDRPGNFQRIVARAEERKQRLAAAASQDKPQQTAAAAASRTVAPSNPSRRSVTKEATVRNAIKLNRINLMGVYGSPSNRRALVRLSNGRYKKVKVGDRIDGGRVSAIGDSELSYVKGRRSIVLKMPRT